MLDGSFTLGKLLRKIAQCEDHDPDQIFITLNGDPVEDIELIPGSFSYLSLPDGPGATYIRSKFGGILRGEHEYYIDIKPRLLRAGSNLKEEYQNLQNNYQLLQEEKKNLMNNCNKLLEERNRLIDKCNGLINLYKTDMNTVKTSVKELKESYQKLEKSLKNKDNLENQRIMDKT